MLKTHTRKLTIKIVIKLSNCNSITEPRTLQGPLSPNGILDKATKLVDGGIVGAESIVVVNNVLYTGLEDGRVVRIEDTGKEHQIITIAKLGNECGNCGFDQ